MILVDKVHQLFRGHSLILLPSSQEMFSFLGWKLRMSVICLCLLDVQTEAAASGGHVPGDPRQAECAMPQHVCSELLKFQEGAWALWLPGAHTVDVVHKGHVHATSSMARVVLGCLPMFEHIPGVHQGLWLKLALSMATPPPPKRPQSRSVHFPSLLLLAWFNFTGASVHLSSLELSWSDHSLFPSEQGLWMKRSRTVPYTGLGILGTQGHRVRALLTAPALLISEKSPVLNVCRWKCRLWHRVCSCTRCEPAAAMDPCPAPRRFYILFAYFLGFFLFLQVIHFLHHFSSGEGQKGLIFVRFVKIFLCL